MNKHIIETTVQKFKCMVCEYEWKPQNINQPPQKCPFCQSRYWKKGKPIKVEEPVSE